MKTTKEIVLVACFSALMIAVQASLSAIVGVELVTVLLLSFCYRFKTRLGIAVANAFTFLRCVIFGFFPQVVILYTVYYNLFALVFSLFNKKNRDLKVTDLMIITAAAVIMTAVFTLLDDVITPLVFSYDSVQTKAYFTASLVPMTVNCVCTAVSVPVLLPPLLKIYSRIFPPKNELR